MRLLIWVECIVLAAPTPALAQLLTGSDIALTDPSPSIAYDDSATPGINWIVRGDDSEYSVYDDVLNQHVLYVNPATPSIALGYSASAGGAQSIALGDSASSGGADSTAMGRDASAGGSSSIAIGREALSAASLSLAMGRDAEVTGSSTQGIAMGYLALVSGTGSIGIGPGSFADGSASTAVGSLAWAVADSASSLGNSAVAGAAGSSAIGLRAYAIADNSTAVGAFSSAEKPYSIVLGAIPGENFATQYSEVGIGTKMPATALHVARNNGTAQILVEDTNAGATPKTLFKIKSNFNAKFEIDNTDGALWAFTNAGTDFRISRQGSGVVEFSVANNGNATLSGALTQNSDVNAKQDVEAVNPDEVLEKVAALPVSTWAYKDAPNARHLGPMAQDFHAAFGLGESDKGISSIDTGGVALASIQALNRKLERQNAELSARVTQLERLLLQTLPQVAQAP